MRFGTIKYNSILFLNIEHISAYVLMHTPHRSNAVKFKTSILRNRFEIFGFLMRKKCYSEVLNANEWIWFIDPWSRYTSLLRKSILLFRRASKASYYQQSFHVRIIDQDRRCLLPISVMIYVFCYFISLKDGSTNIFNDFSYLNRKYIIE